MAKNISRFGYSFLVILLVAGAVQAQYLVSSKAGFVNRVEGKASLKQSGVSLEEQNKAALGTQMNEGDHLSTEADSRAEILLNPGSYLRLSEKTEIVALRTGFDNTRFDVAQGSVIVEIGEIDKKAPLEIGTPRAVVTLMKSGIYRFDVLGTDVSLSVRRGEAYVGTREQYFAKTATKVGNNRAYRLLGNAAPQTVKLSENVFDLFDEWSYIRAESLLAANYSVLRRARSRDAMLAGWIYDPLLNSYTYIPGRGFLLTPYGFGFYSRFSDCSICWSMYYPNYGGYYGGGYYGGSIGSGGTQPAVSPRVSDSDRAASRVQTTRTEMPSRRVEPYARPNYDYGGGRSSRSDSGDFYSSSRGSYDRTNSSSSSSSVYSPPPSAPAPSRVESPSANVGGRGGDSGGRTTTRDN